MVKSRGLMRRRIYNTETRVLDNIAINEDYFKLKVRVEKKVFEKAQPGQFAQIQCSQEIEVRKNRKFEDHSELANYIRLNIDKLNESQLILRRPICIHNAYKEKDGRKVTHIFEFLIRKKRKGTELLSKLKHGDNLNILAPLGNPFGYKKSVDEGREVLIVAGGMGIAPIVFLCNKLIENGVRPTIFFGFEEDFSINYHSTMRKDLRALSKKVHIASNTLVEDVFVNGFVTDILVDHLKKLSRKKLDAIDIFSCGPTPMLKVVAAIAEQYDVNCEMSLEERMACGFGACMGCVCKTKNNDDEKYKRVCVEGPVFNSKEIIFATQS